MKIFIATDVTMRICKDRVYARNKYSTILKRYYHAFGSIVLCSRVEKIETLVDDCDDITDITECVVPISSLLNALIHKDDDSIIRAMCDCNLVVCRCPGIAAYRASDCARKLGIPVFTESMGCAWDAYWNHGLTGKLIAPYMYFKMKSVVNHADYALYVTSVFLQHRYPRKGSSISASNVLIRNTDDSVLEKRIQKIKRMNQCDISLMTTAAVDVRYKGHEYVIKAIPKLNEKGIRVRYFIVGEGKQDYLRILAEKYGVSDQVQFTGRLPLAEVLDLLDYIDIYIQPSLQEGLPRSVIEAMSRGCIVIGAKTAGIPELLESKYVVKRKSVLDIYRIICVLCENSSQEKVLTAQRNFAKAKEFVAPVLDKRRSDYFERIKREIGGSNA